MYACMMCESMCICTCVCVYTCMALEKKANSSCKQLFADIRIHKRIHAYIHTQWAPRIVYFSRLHSCVINVECVCVMIVRL